MRLLPLALGLLCVAATGCITTRDGKDNPSASWRDARTKLGSMAVLAPTLEVAQLTEEALASLPGVEIQDSAKLRNALGAVDERDAERPLSDIAAVEAARRAGLESVCIVSMVNYGGRFQASLIPPAWHLATIVGYNLRILNVASGELLLNAMRSRSTGAYYAVATLASPPGELSEDLKELLEPDVSPEIAEIPARGGGETLVTRAD